MDLIADIGGTNSRLALLDADGRIARSASYRNQEHASLEDVLGRFLVSAGGEAPKRAMLAIAAPEHREDLERQAHALLRQCGAVFVAMAGTT